MDKSTSLMERIFTSKYKKVFPYEIGDEKEINEVAHFLNNENISSELKAKFLQSLLEQLRENRLIIEFFSKIEDKSIYIHLIDLYLNPKTDENLKNAIVSLLKELIINLSVDKKIFDYVYQKIAAMYRGDSELTPNKINDHLSILNSLYGDTEQAINPKNYISFCGKGKIKVEIPIPISFENSISFILNFKIGYSSKYMDEMGDVDYTANLMTVQFDSGDKFTVDLKYPMFVIVKSLRDNFIKTLPLEEWINFIVTLNSVDGKFYFCLYVNGENHGNKYSIPKFPSDCQITGLSFFEGFLGEVTSIMSIRVRDKGPQAFLSSVVLQEFRNFCEGAWKKSRLSKIISTLSKYPAILGNQDQSQAIIRKVKDDILFVFSPVCSQGKILEDSYDRYLARVEGIVRAHTYECLQKKVSLLGGMKNLLPLAEMLLLHQDALTEDVFSNFLNVIVSILSNRKNNIIEAQNIQFFQILSLFLEKYPSKLFTEKILNLLFNIGKVSFKETEESLASIYFESILFNEKILSKYTQTIQLKFWNQIDLFCQSDRTQIGTFLNMKKICLILRYYDEKKYFQMCCKNHFDQFKPEYLRSKDIMNPSMEKKLSDMEGIMKSTIDYQTLKDATVLFKLLTLDISPCLTKFVITIFRTALEKKEAEKKKWKQELIKTLFAEKCDSILANTFRHTLLDVRIEILKFIYQISKIEPSESCKKTFNEGFNKLLKMLKGSLLPGEMFFEAKRINEPKKMTEIAELALHCRMKIYNKGTKFPCSKYNDKVVVFKSNVYEEYISQIYQLLCLWTIGSKIEGTNLKSLNMENQDIKEVSVLELLISFNDQLKDLKFTKNLLETLEKLFSKPKNCLISLQRKTIYSWLLSITFENYKNNDVYAFNIFSKGKNLLVSIAIDSITHFSSIEKKVFPIRELETIFIWGNKVRTSSNDQTVLEFIQLIFSEIFEKLKKNVGEFFDKEKKFTINYMNKNYLIFISFLYNFMFHYKLEPKVQANGYEFLCTNSNSITLPEGFIVGMRIESDKKKTKEAEVDKIWVDFPFFEEINKRFSYIWSTKNTFKYYDSKKGGNKVLKYEDLLKTVILNKEKKNIFLEELKLLCFEEVVDDQETVTPLIRIIPIALANIINTSINICKNQAQIKYWVKEFKHFIRYLIIASTNITPIGQEEVYNKVQEKCLHSIVFGICFLKEKFISNEFDKEKTDSSGHSKGPGKLEKTLSDLVSLCFIIVKEQYSYLQSHHKKTIFKKLMKPARNDLTNCCVFLLFKEYIIDKKTGSPLVSEEQIKKLSISQYINVVNWLLKDDFREAFFENKTLKGKVDYNLFGLPRYKAVVTKRFEKLSQVENEIDESYNKEIMDLIPLYENDLEKYSNNSFVGLKVKKNNFRKIKKELFSWKGMWSDRNLFYNHIEKLKLKMLNHYTKSMLRPLLVPILDLDYYLPSFTHFEKSELFKDTEKIFKPNLDIEEEFRLIKVEKEEKATEVLTENYLREIYRKSNPELSYLYLEFINKIDIGKEEDLISNIQKSNSKSTEESKKNFYLCCFVKQSHHIKGVFCLSKEAIEFRIFLNQKSGTSLSGVEFEKVFSSSDEDYDSDRKTCFGSYFVWHHKDLDKIHIVIPLNEIKFFLRKQYYYKNSGLEFFSKKNKSFYFNFKNPKDRELAINEILSKVKENAKIINDLKDSKDAFDNVIGYEFQRDPKSKKVKKLKLSKIIKKLWVNWKISNFELLMWLNLFSNRSYSDISQYPVFPWVLADYKDPLKKNDNDDKAEPDYVYRDLSLPMGMLAISPEGETRKLNFIENYDTMKSETESETGLKPYVYGTHYSNPVYVANYLTRLFPFSHIMIELNGNKFDDPDRLFFSVENSFYNSTTQKTDVREIIPEFFYLPEMFLNLNNFNLGVKENKEVVDKVFTPCSNNPYDFVMTLRQVLESDEVSYHIQKWIDLIFGYKQRGKEADAAYNVFTEASYADLVDISKEKDKACMFRMVEFGLTPAQSIAKECPMKCKKDAIIKGKELTDSDNNIVQSICEVKYDFKEIEGREETIVKAVCFENDKFSFIFTNNLLIQLKVNIQKIEKKTNCDILKKLSGFAYKFLSKMKRFYKKENHKINHVAFYNKGRNIAIGGFFDGKIVIVNFDAPDDFDVVNPIYLDKSPISSIEISKDDKYVFCGNESGNIVIYKIDQKKWSLYKCFYDSFGRISHIFYSEDLNLWASVSEDSFANIYTFPTCKLVRSLKLPEGIKGDYIFLSSCPIPCIVIINASNEAKSTILVYSINGHYITTQYHEGEILSPILIKDLSFSEYLAYISKDKVFIRTLPSLFLNNMIEIKSPISHLCISEDMKTLYGISSNGTVINILKDQVEEQSDLLSNVGIKLEK